MRSQPLAVPSHALVCFSMTSRAQRVGRFSGIANASKNLAITQGLLPFLQLGTVAAIDECSLYTQIQVGRVESVPRHST